jgi:hypothetical protein
MQVPARLALLALLITVPLGASAQEWFAGGAVGIGQQDDYAVGGPISNRDDTDFAYRLFGGYLISPMQGFVASYVDLGEAFYSGPAFGGFTDRLSADGFDFSYIIGWSPGTQERIRVFGTVGVFAWDQDVVYTEVGSTEPFLYKDDGASFSIGIGTDINLSAAGDNAWGIHVEWQLFKDVGDRNFSGHENDRQMLSAGVSYRFGRD